MAAHIFDTIDQVHNSIHIYNSLVIYPADGFEDISELENYLTEHDYPWTFLKHFDAQEYDMLQANHRMFLIQDDDFREYIFKCSQDLSDITIIFCLNGRIYDRVCHDVKLAAPDEEIIILCCGE